MNGRAKQILSTMPQCMVVLVTFLLTAVHAATVSAAENPVGSADLVPTWRPRPPANPANLQQRHFIDEHTPRQPSAREMANGFLLYSRPNLSLIFDNSVPHGDDQVERLQCNAAVGEDESMTFALYALRHLAEVHVDVSELVSEDGSSRLPRSHVQVHVARSLYQRLAHRPGVGHEFMYMPSWLSDQPSVDVAAGESAWFWLTIRAAPDVQPTKYAGTMTVWVGQQVRASLPVEIQVLPIRLADLRGYTIGYYDYIDHRTAPDWSAADRFALMRAYGMTSVHMGVTDTPRISVNENGNLRVDFTGSSIARGLEAYKRAGFPAPPAITLAGRIMNACRQHADIRSVRFAMLFATVLNTLKEECKENEWPLPILSPRDESAGRPATFHYVAQQLRLMSRAGFLTELNHFLAYPQNTEQWRAACLPYLDVITLGYNTGVSAQGQPTWANCTKFAHDWGKSLWTYNALQPGSVQPTSWRFLTGWFFRTWGKDCTGSIFYTFDYPDTNPYNDLAPRKGGAYGENVRAWYRPDPKRGLRGGPSLTLAWAREGIDDLRYIVTLERLIFAARLRGHAESREAAGRADRVLQKIQASFDFSQAPHVTQPRGGTAQATWERLGEREGMPTASGEYRYNNGWGSMDYNLARQRIAQQIMSLQKMLDRS